MIALFKTYWPHLLILAAVTAFGYKFGHDVGKHAQQADLQATIKTLRDSIDKKTAQILAYEQDKRQAAEQHAAALQKAKEDTAAQRARADQLAAELLQTQAELSQANEQRKKDIPHAIKNDGHAFTGIGPDSLRLYRANLGYTDYSLSGTGQAPGGAALYSADATRTRGGLSPAGLLGHSGDYGEWCLTLRGKLEQLNKFYNDNKERSK
ncbi:hypothetical protein OI450_14350 [Pectobacterium cacticida]|uniref:Uncharacterized protein n=1 Tax=Pectobacterium cacticida TaxID=69221 RepID=A0ABZ2GEW9_9GAMM|nr:hypothetical protein [Pectobacterium cacticida]UYX06097.1 hypothetical protein OI450_14350 [Pectobacterium cacticida]